MRRPPRFALSAPPSSEGVAIVTGAELHHMRDVARLREGTGVSLLGPDGVEYAGRIEHLERDRALVRVEGASRERPGASIILAAALVKGPRMDFIVEKAAELGAAELWPIVCARGVASDPGRERVSRWRRLALSAAKQSLSAAAMEVREPRTFNALIQAAPKDTLAVICTLGAEPLARVIRLARPRALLLACGPEGGFNEAESALALSAGFVAAGLGANRLRSETAALAALSVASGALDEISRGG